MSVIKKSLKKIDWLRNAYSQSRQFYWKVLYAAFPALISKHLYRKRMGKALNLKNPRDFNEKLQWMKLYWRNPLVVRCADKYESREYVKSCGCANILNPLIGVYSKVSEIDWERLPDKFAIKCTHGCCYNVICDDKTKLDKNHTLTQLHRWTNTTYGLDSAEIHYFRITPRIICERYIETDSGLLPVDYKMYCFNGKPALTLVCTDRSTKLKLHFMDLNWQRMDIGAESYGDTDVPKRPACFDAMIKYSEILSRPFPFVRIDYYDFQGEPIFGEMTFTPAACMAKYYNEAGLKQLGDMMQLPGRA